MIAFNETKGLKIASEVGKADSYAARSRGLLGRAKMGAEEGLWIIPCPMIHTFFMAFAIDVLFLDSSLRVVRVIENLKPWRMSPWVFGAHSVLELSAGALDGKTEIGDQLSIR